MARYTNILRDQNLRAIPGALVSVTAQDGTTATLTDDSAQPLDNPFQSDAYGIYTFNTAAGVYTIGFTYGGRTILKEVVIVGAPAADVGTLMVLAADDGSLVKASSTLTVKQWIAQLLTSVGSALVGFMQGGTAGLPTNTVETVLRQAAVHVHLFRKAGDSDDTLATLRAIATGLRVRFVAGMGSGTAGKYILTYVPMTAGTFIFGDGPEKTVIEWANTVTLLQGMFGALGASNTVSVKGITIRDLTLQDDVVGRGFLENHDLVYLCGVEDVLIENVRILGFRGDGIQLAGEVGTPSGAGDYRHNRNVTIQNCVFDGINNDNRAAISVIDCDGFIARGNTVRNTTRSNMPGGFDFEPNPYALYILRNITVEGNQLANVGGNTGAIAFQVPGVVTALPYNIRIANNGFSLCRNTGADISLNFARTFTNADRDQGIVVTGNYGYGGVRPFTLLSAKGAQIDRSNVWEHYDFGGRVGLTATATKPYGCIIMPTLKDVGFAGIQIYRGDYLTFGGSYTDPSTVSLFFDGVAAAGDGTSHVTISNIITNDVRRLNYDAETVGFIAGRTLTGGTSGAKARIDEVIDNGTTGTLLLSSVVGTFQDNEIITDSGTGSATANGTVSVLVAIATSANHSVSATTNRILYDTCQFNGLSVAFAAQDQRGTAVLVAGTVAIPATGVATTSRITYSRGVAGGTLGHLSVPPPTAGTSFIINSSSATDTSTINYAMAPA